MKEYRTHISDEIDESKLGETVRLSGFVSSIRDHGGIMFVDLRDHKGITQLVFHDQTMLENVTRESVICVDGKIEMRDESNFNEKIVSGKVEVFVEKINVISKSKNVLPFEIMESEKVSEDLRLKYRYLDMRNPEVMKKIKLREDVIWEIRQYMHENGFHDCHTPILSADSPEGARCFLVPSRLHHGKFYVLPQSPQQFKQLLMIGGLDKYYQIAPCFRDEDSRAFRSAGEFYQVDIEMSYANQQDVQSMMEELIKKIFAKYGELEFDASVNFPHIKYADAMVKYGSDKPDLRNPIEIKELTHIFANTTFSAFKGNLVRGFALNCGDASNSFYKNLTEYIMQEGAGGLAWLRVLEDGSLKGPITKFTTNEELEALKAETGASVGDDIFIIADKKGKCEKLIGLLRLEIGRKLNLVDNSKYNFCWIDDFPYYEYNEETDSIDFGHNPFTEPQGGLDALNNQDPLNILAYQYDLVCNGVELASGAVRNTNVETMIKAFQIAGYDANEVERRFGALYNAFTYGAPPHAGIAPGLETMLMLLSNTLNIREVIPFPMNAKAQDLLMGAPSEVSEKQLREAHIKVRD